ncbi:hypothetical protein DICVIV_06314 [Dictyocaulus viviparus]|uniref:Condensin complex subunit 1 C-terminal domain-containing protein n=1 Tax=Dictyocaulus viviparus TaxID=29172 RepID=A0A0D8XUU6_DICVI|nr:hypothetical protein DICVIV_06314 [Dictyocaulus viviparus]
MSSSSTPDVGSDNDDENSQMKESSTADVGESETEEQEDEVIRFEIPDRDDDLLSRALSTIVIRKENISFDNALKAGRLFNSFKPDLVNILCHAVGAGDSLQKNLAEMCADRAEVLQMIVYLIHRLTFHIEGVVIKRAYRELGHETHSGKSDIHELVDNYQDESISEDGLATWENLRIKVVEIIGFICCINIPRGTGESIENAIKFLWRPAEANIQMLRTLASIIVNFAAHPRFAKASSKAELQQLFAHLRPICVDFKLASEVARIIVKTSLTFEYLSDSRVMEYPFIEPLKKLSIQGDMDQMMSYMLYFAGIFRPREQSMQSLPRPFALLIQKIAQCAPETFFENISGVLPFLDYDPPSMRNAILGAFCDVVCGPEMKLRYLRPGRDARIVRDIMTDELQAHIADISPQVRIHTLQCWIVIANNRRVPFDALKKGLVFAVAERLVDKSSASRKIAMQFLVLYLLFNPYGKKLEFKSLSETFKKLNEYKERVEFVDPDRPGFFVVMDRFNSFEPKMRKTLECILEDRLYEKDSEGIEDEPLESLITILVDVIEISMRDALCALVKLYYVGKFKNINKDLPRKQLIDALVREFQRYYVSIHISRIGDSFGEELLQEMEVAYEENMDLVEHALRVTQEKLLFAEQMAMMFPILIEALKQNDFADINYAVTFCATCERFQIRNSASALYDMYSLGNAALSTEVLNTVLILFLKKDSKGDIDIVETANGLILKLSDPDMKDRFALNELLYLAFSRNKFPIGLVHHLMKLSLVSFSKSFRHRVDPRGMREYLRDFQKCLRSSDVLVACEALLAISYLVPSSENSIDQDDEAYLYHLRAIDSLFPDIENFLFRVILSDDFTVESQYWYNSMRNCVKAIFALSADVDYIISRIVGKAMWYAHRSAQLLVLFKKGPWGTITKEYASARSEYWNITWQRTTERLLMLIGEVIEGILVYIDNYFPKLLERAMSLDEKAAEELEDVIEPYADYNKEHSAVEMDFAYREGLFARTVSSIAKLKTEGNDIATSPELSPDLEKLSDQADELGEDDSNRPSTEELIRTRTQALLQTRLLHKSGIVGQSLSLVVFFIRCPGIPDGIRDAALRAFSKFLFICPQLTERASPTLFTFICCHPDPNMKEYLLAAGVDIMHRFPAMLENKCLFLFEMPMDADPCVRITALLYLKYLLTHDVLKPRGTLSDTALCLLNRKRADANNEDDENDEREGNLLVNVLPDLICRICRWEEQVPLSAFKYLVRRLLPMIDDKPLDIVVEKMCQRFQFCTSGEATEHNKHIAYYFSYFISQLPLSETSFYKVDMRDALAYFAQFLEDEIIYRDFAAVVNQFISSTQNLEVKHDAEELLRKIEFLHIRSSLTDEERDEMSRAVGPIDLDVPVKLDKDGNPITFSFADCDEPIEYDDN